MAHKEEQQLLSDLDQANQIIDPTKEYYHYKHPDLRYKILAIGFIEASEEACVVYQAQHGNKFVWVRTVDEFLSQVALEDGTEVDRFTKVS